MFRFDIGTDIDSQIQGHTKDFDYPAGWPDGSCY